MTKNNERISLRIKPNSFQSEKTISEEQKIVIFKKKHKASMDQNNQLAIDVDKFS